MWEGRKGEKMAVMLQGRNGFFVMEAITVQPCHWNLTGSAGVMGAEGRVDGSRPPGYSSSE